MNGHIATYLEIVGYGRNDAQDFFIKGIKKPSDRIVISRDDRGVEVFNIGLLPRIRCHSGIDDHAAGGVEDPDLRVHIGGKSFHLRLYVLQFDFGSVQLQGIGIGDPGSFSVEHTSLVPDTVFCRQA